MRVARGIQSWWSRAFNLPVLRQKRLEWVDYLRGIAIILVVYRHVFYGLQRGKIEVPLSLVEANMLFYSFRMPLFFILSGIFITKTLEKASVKKLVSNKFEQLLYPYFIWAVIQITLQIAASRITNSNRTLLDYTYIFYQPRGLDQFWYLPALFNTTIVYVLVKTKLKASTGVQLLLGLALYFIAPYCQMISMLSDWMALYIFFAIGDAVSKIFLKESNLSFFKNSWTLALVIPVFFFTQRYYLQTNFKNLNETVAPTLSSHDYLLHIHARDQVEFLFISLIGCFCMFVIAFQLQKWKALSFLRIFGYHSLYIYVMHVIVTACVRLSLVILFGMKDPVALLLLSIAFGIVIPIVAYNLLIRDSYGWFLFSYRRKKERKAAPVHTMIPNTTAIATST